MKVCIANCSAPVRQSVDPEAYWATFSPPPCWPRVSLFEQQVDWGFHMHSLGVYLLDLGIADEVEFWDFQAERWASYSTGGVLKLHFLDEDDVIAYLERFGYPDLFVNHGRYGNELLRRLEGRCFRVHVPTIRVGAREQRNFGAECYLVDAEEYLDDRSMMYIPVVHTEGIRPDGRPKVRDFIYLAAFYPVKRHDIVVDAVRGTALTGHFHPVAPGDLDLSETHITTSFWNEREVVELLGTSRFAVYPGDYTSSPAAMWECVAAGLPIVVNREIYGGKHLVLPGVTGELASAGEFREVMEHVLANLDSYRPREYFEEHWDTIETIESYLAFFDRMGWRRPIARPTRLPAPNARE